jgi:polysaccharide pyruvyl transferase WcaK-like protein
MRRPLKLTAAPRVGLFGLLGNGNLGNDVSMQSVLSYLQTSHPNAIVDAMCKGPDTISSRYGIPAVTMNWYQRYENTASGASAILLKIVGKGVDIFRTASWVGRHDVVIVPGMGTMEATLPLEPWGLPYSFILLCGWAKLFGGKVAFISIGAGPVKKRATRALLDASARLAFYRSYRDAPSREMMGQRGVDVSRDNVYSDLAFGIPPAPPGSADPRLVCVGVMDYHGSNDDRRQADAIREHYVAAMKSLVRWLIDNERNVKIVVGDDNQSDKDVGAEILADALAYRPDVESGGVVMEHASTFAALMLAMTPAHVVVATRFHSVVCALRLGKPVVALSYGPKFAPLLESMGLTEFSQSAKFPDADALIAQFTELDKRCAELQQAIAAGNAEHERSVAAQFAELSAVLLGMDGVR